MDSKEDQDAKRGAALQIMKALGEVAGVDILNDREKHNEAYRRIMPILRELLIASAAMLVLFVVGCSSVTVPPDASVGDAPVVLRNGCGDLLNTFDTYGPDCDRTGLSCPWAEPVEELRIHECNLAVYDARGSCEGMRAALEACR